MRVSYLIEKRQHNGETTDIPKFRKSASEYYILKGTREGRSVKNNAELLQILNDKYEQLNKFLNNNHLNIKKTNDLIRAIKYYNQL